MILEELVATGAVNDFLRMMIPSQPAIYPPLYNLSLKEFYTFFSFFPFFPLIDLCTHKPFPRSSPLLATKETKAKQNKNKTTQNLPIPPLLIPKNQLRILPTTPHLHSHITFHLPPIPDTRRSQITTSDILSRTKEFLARGTRICENSVGGGRTLKIPCIVGATSVDPAGVGARGVCGVGVCER